MRILSFLLVALAACAGTQEEAAKPTAGMPPPPPTKPMASGDVSFEIPAYEIKGVVLEPEALGRPGMPLVEAKKKTTLEKQRALVQSTKDPVQKQAQAAILATMLYLDAKNNKNNEKALLGDARQVLRDVAQQAGEKAIDEITVRLLGSYELLLEDYPAAEKAWQAVIEKDPKSKELPYNRAWLAFAQLKQFKNAEALASIGSEKLDDKEPELAYVAAWARLRSGDNPGAWQAITIAAKGWGQTGNRDELDREILMFAARTRVALDQAVGFLTSGLGRGKPQQFELVAKLGLTGYGPIGRWADAVAVLDKALEIGGGTHTPTEQLVIRNAQAEYAVPLDQPDVAAKFGKQAIETFGPCGAKCGDRDKANFVQRIYLMGRLFHILYATANDSRYYKPTHELYALTIPILSDLPMRTQAEKDSKTLEATLRNMKVGTGTHDKGALQHLLGYHNPEVQGCYELALQGNPKLGGTITVNLESDASGAIKGVTTEPRAGKADLAAVAGCIEEHAKHWKLTKRGMPGSTRIKMSYTLAVKK